MDNPLISYKKEIEEQLGDVVSDFLLNAVWDFIVDKIGYNPMLSSRKDFVKGNGTDRLYLRCRPIKTVDKVVVDGVQVKTPRFTDRYLALVTTKGYERYDKPTLYSHNTTSEIEVDYTAGYETLPSNLVLAAISLLNGIKQDVGESGNLSSYKIDTIAYTFKNQSERNSTFMLYLKPFLGVF